MLAHRHSSPEMLIGFYSAGTIWGHSKMTQLITYCSLIHLFITYATPIWFPNASPLSILEIQTIHNSPLRIVIEEHKMFSIDHFDAETILPVHSHLPLLYLQFLARALHPKHPSPPVVSAGYSPRSIKFTLQSSFFSAALPYLVDGSSLCDPSVQRSTSYQPSIPPSCTRLLPNRAQTGFLASHLS